MSGGRPWGVTILLCLLGSCSEPPAPEKAVVSNDPPSGIDLRAARTRPDHTLDATSDEAVATFVGSHPEGDVHSLMLLRIRCGPDGFSQLRRLKGLYVLSLSGGWTTEPVEWVDEKPKFKSVLSDAVVREIAEIESLRVLNLWYGSLTKEQKQILESALPKCELVENLNKF